MPCLINIRMVKLSRLSFNTDIGGIYNEKGY